MITDIFEFYYTMNMYPSRLKPLTKEELARGMSNDAVDEYLALMEQLYNVFCFDVNEEITPLSRENRIQKQLLKEQIYNSIIKLLFKQDAISDTAFCELHKVMPVEYNFIELPNKPGKYIGDSLDDFRLAFEYGIVDSDEKIDMCDEYLDDRYGYNVCVRPNTPNGFITKKDLCVIRFEGAGTDISSVQASYWEIKQLLKKIRNDIECNTNEQKRLDEIICDTKIHIDSINKSVYGRPKNTEEWYTIKRALEKESDFLWQIEDEISGIFETLDKPEDGVGSVATLFIYKGNILCHKYKHHLTPAIALIHDDQDKEVELDVEYCPTCKRYLLNYTSYEQYRERHGLLIGKLKMISSNSDGVEFDMASESPLKLCGYNVSQGSGLSTATRQFLLAKIIHDGIMSKIDVIHYLEHFINMNGAKKENVLALEKWYDDLDFVHKYNRDIQPRIYIEQVKKY